MSTGTLHDQGNPNNVTSCYPAAQRRNSAMKRLAVSSRHRAFPCGVCGVQSSAATVVRCGLARFCQSSIRARQGRGLTRSPAHEGIRGVGAPSIQRPCDGGQVNIRAHPPIEPARDQGAHGREQAPGDCVTGLLWFSDLESVDIKILCSLAPQLTDVVTGHRARVAWRFMASTAASGTPTARRGWNTLPSRRSA